MSDERKFYNSNNTPIEPFDDEIVESFFVQIPEDCIAMANSGEFLVRVIPPGIAKLDEPAIRNGIAVLVKLRNMQGEVIGFASELEVFPEVEDPMQEVLAWDTHWTLILPGRGTLCLHQIECTPEFYTDIVGPVLANKRDWVGDVTFVTSIGPLENGRGRIVAGTGEFEQLTGSFIEHARTTRFTHTGEMDINPIELRVFKKKVPPITTRSMQGN